MQNGIFKLDYASIGDAALTAAVAAVVTALVGVVQTQGFDVFSADWVTIGRTMANFAILAAVISVGKDFISNDSGQVLGMGKPY